MLRVIKYWLPQRLSLKLRKGPKIKYFSSNNGQYSFTSVIPQFFRKYQKIVIVMEKSLHLQHDKWIIVKYRVSYLFMCSFLNTKRTQGVFPYCYENLFININSHIYIYTSLPTNWMGRLLVYMISEVYHLSFRNKYILIHCKHHMLCMKCTI